MNTAPNKNSLPTPDARESHQITGRRRASIFSVLLCAAYAAFFSPLLLSIFEGSPFPKIEAPERYSPVVALPQAPHWEEVARISGRSVQSTPPFLISGIKWRVRWKLTRRQKVSEELLKIRVYREDKGDYDMFANVSDGEGDFIIYGEGLNSIGVFSHHDYEIHIDDMK